MTPKRPRIYCQFVDRKTLEPTSGDRINEIKFYRALSTFADVYYNDVLIDWKSNTIGDDTGLNAPSRDYDLYYVRANAELFKSLPHPKVTLAYPYDEEVFRQADALFVTTGAWRELLRAHSSSKTVRQKLSKWYPETISLPERIINIQQTIDPVFKLKPNSNNVFKWRARMTGARSLGYFGRITEKTIPTELFDGLDIVRQRLGGVADPIAVCAGSVRTPLPQYSLNLGQIPYDEMPSVLGACYASFASVGEDSGYLGSGKILESMATGTPIVCEANPVRSEQLGGDYPGSYTGREQALDVLWRVLTDNSFHKELKDWVTNRSAHFLPSSNGLRIQTQFSSSGLL